MITVFFRYDDYSSLSSSVADRGVIDVFRRHGLTCTFAVVPAITSIYPWVQGSDQRELPLNGEKAEELRQAVLDGTVDLALHGWRHLANEYTCHPDPSEFRGLSLESQVDLLSKGRDFLEGATSVRPTLFVPPWNSYDETTEKALAAAGFVGISASRNSPKPAHGGGLAFAPMTTEIPGLRDAIARAESSGEGEAVIGVMMHPYDFVEAGDEKRAVISIPDFERLVVQLQQGGIRIASISACVADGLMSRQRFMANRPSVFESCYPPTLRKVESDPVYHSADVARRTKLYVDAKFFALMLLLAAGGALSAWVAIAAASKWLQFMPALLALVSVAGIVGLTLRAARARAIYARGTALLAVLAGALFASVW